jgi:hypothetical protein
VTVEAILARARRRMTDVMSDSVTVRRSVPGAGTYSTVTKTHTPTAAATVYTGAAIVRADPSERTERLGEDGSVVVWRYVVKFPAETDIRRGDSVEVTASTYDAQMVGVSVWVLEVEFDEWHTARVAHCSDQRAEVTA